MTKIAAIQMNSSDDVHRNLAFVAEAVEEIAKTDAKMIFLPECFGLMPNSAEQLRECAESYGDGEMQYFLAELAREHRRWIVAGSLPLKSVDALRPFNSLLVFDSRGVNVARYDKIHLFDVALPSGETHCESDYTSAGDDCAVQQTPLGVLGLSVCYDMRFPEVYRRLAAMGAVALTMPSAFTVSTGAAHWETLLRARAVENSCYVIAPAQVGEHANGRKTYGHSLIVDPWGKVLAEGGGDKPQVLSAEVDTDLVARIRQQLPSLSNRRDDVFGDGFSDN